MIEAIRFFRVVPPVPSLMTTTFIVVTSAAVAAILVDAAHARGTLTAVLVLQSFACSSGFAGHARRGHYDLLLTRGERRSTIAGAHWLMSSLPGIASWIAISAAEALATGAPGVGFTSGTTAAVATVSMVAWAATVPLPRFAAAIGWLVTVVLGVAIVSADAIPPLVSAVLYPPRLIGASVGGIPIQVGSALTVALGSIVIALIWVERNDIRLEAAQ